MIVFLRGEKLYPHSAHLRKIPGWIVLVHEKFSVNKWAYRKKTIKLYLMGFCLFPFCPQNFGSLPNICFKNVKFLRGNSANSSLTETLRGELDATAPGVGQSGTPTSNHWIASPMH